ncbi:MAG: hypothetical protein ACR2HM_10220 [Acidimicrobiales bacterium]
MVHPLPVVVGILAVVVLGTGISAAVVRAGDETPSPAVTTSTIDLPTTVPAPTTIAARPTTTRPTTTTKAPLTRAAATKGLCADIDASVRLVAGGNTIGGGLRLLRAVNTYDDAADPAVVAPARRMLAAGLDGDLERAAVATEEAAAACRRLGFPISLPTSGPGPGIPGRDRPCGIVSC